MFAALIAVALAGGNAGDVRMYDAKLVKCYDGDTCTFDFHMSAPVGLGIVVGAVLEGQRVRLCDIDTPEMRGGTEETKAAARKARDALLAEINQAKLVQVGIPQSCDWRKSNTCDERGKYGRWLAYIYADGVNLNEWMIAQGHATAYAERCLK